MIWGPEGRWQFQGRAPTYGTYRVVGDVVCRHREGARQERCAKLSIGPQGPVMTEWRDFAISED